ncbi:MAG: hypothetical protein ABI718_08350 [Acidobacteriota bacterium]
MSRPIERHSELLDQILNVFDLSHDFGRKRAYEAVIDHARETMLDDPHCDEFLRAAAKRLGFAPVTFETLESRVKLSNHAWLDIWISDEDEEVAITGSRDGLQYMIDLLSQLRNSTEPDEHIHLDRSYLPLTESSANLVLFKEDENWFTGAVSEADQEKYPKREIDPTKIYAMQFIHYPPDDLPITAQKLYRVVRVQPAESGAENVKDFPEGLENRYYFFAFVADNGEKFSYVFHLDDPGVNFFTHREILSLTLQQV